MDLAGAAATSASGAVRRALTAFRGVFLNRTGCLKRASGKMFKFARVTLKFAVSRLHNPPTPRSSAGGHFAGLSGFVLWASKMRVAGCLRGRSQLSLSKFAHTLAGHSNALVDSCTHLRSHAALSGTNRRVRRTPRKRGGACLPCQSPALLCAAARRAARAHHDERRPVHDAPLARRRDGRHGGVARHLRVRGARRPVGLIRVPRRRREGLRRARHL